MIRTPMAWVAASSVAVLVLAGCGNMKKDQFLPEYEAYKADTAERLTGADSSISAGEGRLTSLEGATTDLGEAVEDAKNDAIANAEQGDADTLSSANSNARDMDAGLRDELQAAIDAARKDAAAGAAEGDDRVMSDVESILADARDGVMAQIDSMSSKSLGDMESLRAETAETLRQSVPISVGTVYFGSGATGIGDAAKKELDKSIADIKDNPSAVVLVTGHADSRPVLSGSFMTNLQLSEARARAVAKYLESRGVSNKIVVSGRGHFNTVGGQGTMDGQKKSRRVEVAIASE
jgi:chemotaxis protein MotB